MRKWWKNIGPATLVTAAFIGPGTVTVCSIAGFQFGYNLLWALIFSIGATIVLQEMSARLGIVTKLGLGEALRSQLKSPLIRNLAIALVLTAIVIGNGAYEGGNISGAQLGLSHFVTQSSFYLLGFEINWISILIGLIAFGLLWRGSYKFLERTLIFLVLVMSLSFLTTAIIVRPDLTEIFSGMVPSFPDLSTFTIIGLIGTTVVPYNLFLHASLAKKKWTKSSELKDSRRDIFISIIIGGLVSMAILIVGANISGQTIHSAADLAGGLQPLFGDSAVILVSIGLFAAGITSAVTAPLAASYAATGILGWSDEMKSKKFRAIWMIILGIGILFSSTGMKPIDVIQIAQVANGILLPVIGGFLLWIVNQRQLMKVHHNTNTQNILGFIVLGIVLILGLKSIWSVFA